MSITVTKVGGYGYRRDKLDPRDIIFNSANEIRPPSAVPLVVDLEPQMPGVYGQLDLGSCTANADCALAENAEMKQGEGTDPPSRLFLYLEERRVGGYPLDQDTGAEVRDGIKVLVSEGVPSEALWPYDTSQFAVTPPQSVYDAAKKHEALQYKRIVVGGPGAPVRSALAAGFPVAFGFPVPSMFEDSNWPIATLPLPLPNAYTQFIGGHAVVIVGYDWSLTRFKMPVFKIRNSWSADWGVKGHFWMPYNWFDPYRQLAGDLWIVERMT